jgi:multidrug efflux pump subunit AcrA (membrane-fusion protein)
MSIAETHPAGSQSNGSPTDGRNVTRRGWGRKALSAALVALLLVLGGGAFLALASLRQAPPVEPPPPRHYNVEAFLVEDALLREMVLSYGTAVADREVTLSAEVAGRITAIHDGLRVGLRVEPQPAETASPVERIDEERRLLVTIDPETYRQRVAQYEARIREAETQITQLEQEQKNNARRLARAREDDETARREYERTQRQFERSVATEAELSQALLNRRRYEDTLVIEENEAALYPLRIQSARTQLDTLRAELRIAEEELAKTRVFAPFRGILSEVLVETGQSVRVGDPLVRITDATPESVVEVPLPLKLADFAKLRTLLRAGQTPRVDLMRDLSDESPWVGRLVRTAPEADEQTRTIKVYVEVDNADPQNSPALLPGTFVYARIHGPLLENATVVPRDAIVNHPTRGPGLFIAAPDPAADETDRQADQKSDQNAGRSYRAEWVALPDHRTLQTLAVIDRGVFAGLPTVRAGADDGAAEGVFVILTNLDVLSSNLPQPGTADDAADAADEPEQRPEIFIDQITDLRTTAGHLGVIAPQADPTDE